MRRWSVLVLVGGGCVSSSPDYGATWIAPFDGQTAVSAGVQPTAVVRTDLPDDWELDPDTIVVADADDGSRVPGEIERDAAEIRFVPDEPLVADHTYLWSVSAPSEQFRGPSVAFPPLLEGVATFSTAPTLDVLDAWVRTGNAQPCALLSRIADPAEYADLLLTVDAVDLDAGWGPVEDVPDPGSPDGAEATVICAARATALEGELVRLTLGERAWSWEIGAGDAVDVLHTYRRYSPDPEN